MRISRAITRKLSAALETATSYSYTSGATHNFYHYPARFSPEIASAVIDAFSEPGDVVVDPFMGGGTSIIEGLLAGRRVIGTDINALAHFVADVRTTPLSAQDRLAIERWAAEASDSLGGPEPEVLDRPRIANLPRAVETFVAGAQQLSDRRLMQRRQQRFARCALLRLGQWALDCRDFAAPRRKRLAEKLPELVTDMLDGLDDFVDGCRSVGVQKNRITHNRLLIHGNAAGLRTRGDVQDFGGARLVFTSPPYPKVHVLYHRWQYRGRKETPAPYWIARVPDGYYESYYTGGSRTPTGQRNYFTMITTAFRSILDVLEPDGTVVQLIGFSDIRTQLPLYLAAMESAGFTECSVPQSTMTRLERQVPNRKWYAKLQDSADAASELLLFHRPQRRA